MEALGVEQNVQPAIKTLIQMFELGSPDLLDYVAADIDLRIEHYRDDVDVSWQYASNLQELMELLGRLVAEVFPQGTKIVSLDSRPLGGGWYQTKYVQRFWYPVQGQEVVGNSLFISHESQGRVDFLREVVTSVEPA